MTGVVYAVGEEEDEVACERICCAKLIAAGLVDGVEENSAAEAAGVVCGDIAESRCKGIAVAGPILQDL